MADNHKIKNIYWMLSYAYSSLKESEYHDIAAQHFHRLHDLLSAILVRGITAQSKQGLMSDYINETNAVASIKGKINITQSIKSQSMRSLRMVCEYDLFSKNNYLNQILKTTLLLLVGLSDDLVKHENKVDLKKLLFYFDGVEVVSQPLQINWSLVIINRNYAEYRLLINICYLVIKGLLLSQDNGQIRMRDYLHDEEMSRLYEKFILSYYQKEHHELTARADKIDWDLAYGESSEMLPEMRSDITLHKNGKRLIIDAKYYSYNTVSRFPGGKQKLISSNLYQIQSYVNNADLKNNGTVGGALLYAKTDEDFEPLTKTIGGHKYFFRTLDLNVDFSKIRKQLDDLPEQFY